MTYDYGGVSTPANPINGRMLSVTDARGTTSLSYELGCDRVKSVTDPVTGTFAYTSNPYGQRTTMTLPGGGTFTYTYNLGGSGASWFAGETVAKDDPNSLSPRLQSVTDDLGKRGEYNPLGSFTNFPISGRLVQAISNQTFDASLNRTAYTQSDYTFDPNRGNLNTLKHTYFYKDAMQNWQSKLLTQNDYTYDDAGMKRTNRVRAGDGTDRTETYGYDEQYRLKTVDYGDGGTQSYLFDAMGNRTSKTDSGTGTEGYTFDAANRLLSKAGAAYTNDLDGNTLTGGGRVNSWDGQNRLVKCVSGANTSTYKYGSDGLRRQSTINGVTTDTVLDNGMLVRERVGAVNKATYFVGARGPEYRRDDTGAVRWYLYDGLGSSLGEVDPSGNVTSSRKYDVYGAVRGGVNSGGTSKQKFVGALGHTSEDETGLIYMRARYYDPATGRFISQDLAMSRMNWFMYCKCNPVCQFDGSGLDSISISEIISRIKKVVETVDANYSFPLITKVGWKLVAKADRWKFACDYINVLVSKLGGGMVNDIGEAAEFSLMSERDNELGNFGTGADMAYRSGIGGSSAAHKVDATAQLVQLIYDLLMAEI